MIQRTFTIHSLAELPPVLHFMGESEDYRNASARLLQVFTADTGAGHIEAIQRDVREELPGVTLVGMTLASVLGDLVFFRSEIICSFLLFDEAGFSVYGRGVEASELALAGAEVYSLARSIPFVRGMMVMAAGTLFPLQNFLGAAHPEGSEIPVFGARAGGGSTWISSETGEVRTAVFTGGEIYTHGIVSVLFHGEGLHLRTAYNFGWHPIGKQMAVTKAKDNCVETIDGEPAANVYRTYLGVTSFENLADNICEFPLVVNRRGRNLGRIGMRCRPNGAIDFSCDIYEGETVRLSYGNTTEILGETFQDSLDVAAFEPQAVLLVICGNRIIFMHDEAAKEITYYENVLPDTVNVHGFSEILIDGGGGGELNSALVSVAMREGEPRRHGGQRRHAEAAAELAGGASGARIPLVRRLVTFLEATTQELSDMAETARAANRAKSAFLSNMSHEIRTPINAVLGLDEMILREAADPAIRSYANDIQSAGRSLLGIINDVLDFSKIEAGKMEILPADYDLSDTVSDLINMITPRAEAKKLSFLVNVDEGMPYRLHGDETRIRQCALNIMTNAVKYTRDGSVTVDVGYEKVDGGHILLKVRVADTGIGIKPEDLKRLFTPFERIEEKRNRTIEGTGLGMSIVNNLLSLMGTRLDVQSEYGRGSVFSFAVLQKVLDWTPMGSFTERHRQSLNASVYQESFQAPDAHILVIDDTPMNLTVIRGLLRSTRIQVDTAESAAQALEMAHDTPYHLLLVDHLMPKMDGIQMLHALRADSGSANQRSLCIALTANAINGAREMYLAEGFQDYLSKPVDGKTLEAALLQYLPQELILRPGQEGFAAADGPRAPAAGGAGDGGASAELFADLFGLDVATGVKNCGGKDVFMDAVKAFYEAIPGKAQLIGDLAAMQNVRDYTVQVHALKSTARLIGALRLSEDAARLEQCGDREDMAEIAARTPALLEDYRAYAARLQPLCGGAAKKALPVIPPDRLREALEALREVVSVFDFDTADAVVAELEAYQMPGDFAPSYEQIKEKLRGADREALLELLHRLL